MRKKYLRIVIVVMLLAAAGAGVAGIVAYSLSLDSSASFPVDI